MNEELAATIVEMRNMLAELLEEKRIRDRCVLCLRDTIKASKPGSVSELLDSYEKVQMWRAEALAAIASRDVDYYRITYTPVRALRLDEALSKQSQIIMQLAKQEAQRFNHDYIGTEHVLLAIVKEGKSIAAAILVDAGIDLRTIRLEVEKAVNAVNASPEMMPTGNLPLTARMEQVISYAKSGAALTPGALVEATDILMGLIRAKGGIAADILQKYRPPNGEWGKGPATSLALNETIPKSAPTATEVTEVTEGDRLMDFFGDKKTEGGIPYQLRQGPPPEAV